MQWVVLSLLCLLLCSQKALGIRYVGGDSIVLDRMSFHEFTVVNVTNTTFRLVITDCYFAEGLVIRAMVPWWSLLGEEGTATGIPTTTAGPVITPRPTPVSTAPPMQTVHPNQQLKNTTTYSYTVTASHAISQSVSISQSTSYSLSMSPTKTMPPHAKFFSTRLTSLISGNVFTTFLKIVDLDMKNVSQMQIVNNVFGDNAAMMHTWNNSMELVDFSLDEKSTISIGANNVSKVAVLGKQFGCRVRRVSALSLGSFNHTRQVTVEHIQVSDNSSLSIDGVRALQFQVFPSLPYVDIVNTLRAMENASFYDSTFLRPNEKVIEGPVSVSNVSVEGNSRLAVRRIQTVLKGLDLQLISLFDTSALIVEESIWSGHSSFVGFRQFDNSYISIRQNVWTTMQNLTHFTVAEQYADVPENRTTLHIAGVSIHSNSIQELSDNLWLTYALCRFNGVTRKLASSFSSFGVLYEAQGDGTAFSVPDQAAIIHITTSMGTSLVENSVQFSPDSRIVFRGNTFNLWEVKENEYDFQPASYRLLDRQASQGKGQVLLMLAIAVPNLPSTNVLQVMSNNEISGDIRAVVVFDTDSMARKSERTLRVVGWKTGGQVQLHVCAGPIPDEFLVENCTADIGGIIVKWYPEECIVKRLGHSSPSIANLVLKVRRNFFSNFSFFVEGSAEQRTEKVAKGWNVALEENRPGSNNPGVFSVNFSFSSVKFSSFIAGSENYPGLVCSECELGFFQNAASSLVVSGFVGNSSIVCIENSTLQDFVLLEHSVFNHSKLSIFGNRVDRMTLDHVFFTESTVADVISNRFSRHTPGDVIVFLSSPSFGSAIHNFVNNSVASAVLSEVHKCGILYDEESVFRSNSSLVLQHNDISLWEPDGYHHSALCLTVPLNRFFYDGYTNKIVGNVEIRDALPDISSVLSEESQFSYSNFFGTTVSHPGDTPSWKAAHWQFIFMWGWSVTGSIQVDLARETASSLQMKTVPRIASGYDILFAHAATSTNLNIHFPVLFSSSIFRVTVLNVSCSGAVIISGAASPSSAVPLLSHSEIVVMNSTVASVVVRSDSSFDSTFMSESYFSVSNVTFLPTALDSLSIINVGFRSSVVSILHNYGFATAKTFGCVFDATLFRIIAHKMELSNARILVTLLYRVNFTIYQFEQTNFTNAATLCISSNDIRIPFAMESSPLPTTTTISILSIEKNTLFLGTSALRLVGNNFSLGAEGYVSFLDNFEGNYTVDKSTTMSLLEMSFNLFENLNLQLVSWFFMKVQFVGNSMKGSSRVMLDTGKGFLASSTWSFLCNRDGSGSISSTLPGIARGLLETCQESSQYMRCPYVPPGISINKTSAREYPSSFSTVLGVPFLPFPCGTDMTCLVHPSPALVLLKRVVGNVDPQTATSPPRVSLLEKDTVQLVDQRFFTEVNFTAPRIFLGSLPSVLRYRTNLFLPRCDLYLQMFFPPPPSVSESPSLSVNGTASQTDLSRTFTNVTSTATIQVPIPTLTYTDSFSSTGSYFNFTETLSLSLDLQISRTMHIPRVVLIPPSKYDDDTSPLAAVLKGIVGPEAALAIAILAQLATLVTSITLPTASTVINRLACVVKTIECPLPEFDARPSFIEHPLRIPLGTGPLRFYVGSALFSLVLVYILVLSLEFCRRKMKQMQLEYHKKVEKSLWELRVYGTTITYEPELLRDQRKKLLTRTSALRAFGLVVTISFGFLFPPIVGSSVTLLFNNTDIFEGVMSAFISFAGVLIFVWMVRHIIVNNHSKVKDVVQDVGMLQAPFSEPQDPPPRSPPKPTSLSLMEGNEVQTPFAAQESDVEIAVSHSPGSLEEQLKACIKTDRANVEPDSFFIESFGPFFSSAKVNIRTIARAYFFADVLISSAVAALAGIRPRNDSCYSVSVSVNLLYIVHFVYYALMRPFDSKLDLFSTLLFSGLQFILGLTCSAAISDTSSMDFAAIALLVEIFFFLVQAIVHSAWRYRLWMRHLNWLSAYHRVNEWRRSHSPSQAEEMDTRDSQLLTPPRVHNVVGTFFGRTPKVCEPGVDENEMFAENQTEVLKPPSVSLRELLQPSAREEEVELDAPPFDTYVEPPAQFQFGTRSRYSSLNPSYFL